MLLLICCSDRASWKPNMRPMPLVLTGHLTMSVCSQNGFRSERDADSLRKAWDLCTAKDLRKHDAKPSAEIWNGTYLNNVVNPTIGLPFGDDVYHPSMVILGVVYKWVTKHFTACSTLPTVSTIIMFQYPLVIQEYWQEYRTKPWKISHWCWVTMATLDSQRLRGPLFSPGSVIAEELLNHRQ